MTPWRTMSVALQASTTGYVSGLAGASAATKKFGADAERSFNQADRAAERSENRWKTFGRTVALGLGALAVALGFSIREAVSWESAWAGVTKTVDGTSQQLQGLESDLLDMARRLPSSRTEIASVAEAAGQLGVATGDVARFTETMIALGVSTNLSADDAATGLARFMNIMGTQADQVERLGATLVDLGNKGASTEAEILQMATRMAGGGRLIGLTEANVLALSNALSSIGVQAELGSGVMTRFFTKLYSAAKEGDLQAWADAARISLDDFTDLMRTDTVGAIDALVGGMAKTSAEGGNLVAILDDLGLKGTLNTQVLAALVGGYDTLHKSIADGNEAWSEGTALADEAAKRYATAESQLKVFGNKVTDIARVTGAQLIPMMLGALDAAERFGGWLGKVGLESARRLEGAWGDLVESGGNIVEMFGDVWDVAEPIVGLLLRLGGAAIIGGITALASAIESSTGFLVDNEAAIKAATVATIAYLAAQSPSALSAILWGLGNMLAVWSKLRAAIASTAILQGLQGIAGGFAMMATSVTAGAVQVRAGFATMASGVSGLALGFGAVAAAATVFFMGIRNAHAQAQREIDALKPPDFDDRSIASLSRYAHELSTMAVESAGAADANKTLLGLAKGSAELLSPMENSIIDTAIAAGDYTKAAEAADEATRNLLAAYKRAGDEIGMSVPDVERWVHALDLPRHVIDDPEQLATAIEEASNAAEHGTPATDQLTSAWETLADETSNATDQLKAWREQIDAIIGIQKNLYDATTSYGAAVDALNESIKENGRSFDASAEKGRANRDALSQQIDSAIDLAAALAEQNGSLEDGTNALAMYREQIISNLEAQGLSRAEAEKQVDALGLTTDALDDLVIDAASATGKVDDLNNALARTPDGKTVNLRVTAQWDQAAKELAFVLASSGLGSTGQVFGGGGQRWGGITHYAAGGLTKYASGGLSRQAQVGSGRNLVWWDEPETGGEAYVPKNGRRDRSLPVLSEAASWYGMVVVPKSMTGMLAGGMMGAKMSAASPAPIFAPQAPAPIIHVHVDGSDSSGGIGAIYGGVHVRTDSAGGRKVLDELGIRG